MKPESKLLMHPNLFCKTVAAGLLIGLLAFSSTAWSDEHHSLPAIDKRLERAGKSFPLSPDRAKAVSDLQTAHPKLQIEFDRVIGSPKWIGSPQGFLTGPDEDTELSNPHLAGGLRARNEPRDPHGPVKRFLEDQAPLFGHGAEALRATRITREFVDKDNGMRTVVWQQEVEGIPVFEGVLIGHITKRGELVNLSSQVVPDTKKAIKATLKNPLVDAAQALIAAAASLGENIALDELELEEQPRGGNEKRHSFKSAKLAGIAEVRLTWLAVAREELLLCWDIHLSPTGPSGMYRLLLDAQSGEVLIRRSLTAHISNASYRVFTSDSPSPFSPGHASPSTAQPTTVSRTLVTLSAVNLTASPNGWINDGDNETRGNNVDAHLDHNFDDQPDLPRPQGSPFRVFDFPLNLAQAPATYASASVVNSFYWCNWMHDQLYSLGFTEAAGNFQVNNFGRGGTGNDPVLVRVQRGEGANGAFFLTPVSDGISPQMRLYLFIGPTPDRDSALDAEIILHEYAHGLSNRRVGGGVGLEAFQSLALGEGWSDFYSLALLSASSDAVNGNYGPGGYSLYEIAPNFENYYYGIRRYPYSTDMSKNPLTFKDIDQFQELDHSGIPRSWILPLDPEDPRHYQGEVWCVTLWEARANLITKYGFSVGNQRILKLVTDGLNLCPPNPNFLQARDAILQADLLTGGADKTELWTAFAKRGMGFSAWSPPSGTTEDIGEAFDMPPANGVFWAYNAGAGSASSPAVGLDGTVYIGTSNPNYRLHAINPDGTVKWTFTSQLGWAFNAPPTVGPDGTIYVGNNDWRFYALNPDGSVKWTYYAGGQIFSAPAIGADGTIYFTVDNVPTGLTALNPNGTLKWAFNAGNYVQSSPAVGLDGTIYFGSKDNKVYAVSDLGTSGSALWTYPTAGLVTSSPGIDTEGNVYIGSWDGKLYSFTATGTLRWSYNAGALIRSSPTIGLNGRVYFTAENKKVYSLNPNGTLVAGWPFTMGWHADGSPAIGANGTVFVPSGDGKLYELNSNGTLKKSVSGTGGMSSPAFAAGNRLFFMGGSQAFSYYAGTSADPGPWPVFHQDARRLGNRLTLKAIGGRMTKVGNPNFEFGVYCHTTASDFLAIFSSADGVHFIATGETIGIQPGQGFYPIETFAPADHNYYIVRKGFFGTEQTLPYGYIRKTIPLGTSMLANPLNSSNQNVRALFRGVPNGTTIQKYDPASGGFSTADFLDDAWEGDNFNIGPGEGFFINNNSASAFTVTFVGEVLQGYLVNPIPAGFSIRSSMVPQSGAIDADLNYPVTAGENFHQFNPASGYFFWEKVGSQWYRDGEPSNPFSPTLGESFWIDSPGKTWSRTYFPLVF